VNLAAIVSVIVTVTVIVVFAVGYLIDRNADM
jgi:hypothetical protein